LERQELMQARTAQLLPLAAIILYRNLGWEVIPIHPNSKKPIIEWSEPTEPIEVNTVFQDNPKANVGVVLGERSRGLACQDFEAEKDYLEYYGESHSKLEETTIVNTTPNGGIHVLVYSTNPFTKKIRVCEEHEIDVLGDGCMTLMPPSKINGKKYETLSTWKVNLEPDNNLLESTSARCSQLGWRVSKTSTRPRILSIIGGVAEGRRNDSAFNYARHLIFEVKLDYDTVWFEMQRWNKGNKPPLTERELASVLESATRYNRKVESDLWGRFR